MISPIQLRISLILALLAMAGVLRGADATAAKEKAQAGVTAAREQAAANRDRVIAEIEALTKQLKNATETQRAAILEKMKEREKAFREAQVELSKQIREDARRDRTPGKK